MVTVKHKEKIRAPDSEFASTFTTGGSSAILGNYWLKLRHEMQTIFTDVCSVRQSVCLPLTDTGSASMYRVI